MKAKPFIVVVCCLFMLLMFAGGMISENDLTPDTPPATPSTFDDISPLRAPAGSSASGCYSPYVIQPGDTLSRIANACGLSLNELLAANPGLANPNLIYANQQINIPYAAQPGANPLADAAATAAHQQQAAADGASQPAGVLSTGGQDEVVISPAETGVMAADTQAPVATEPAPHVTQASASAAPAAAAGDIPGYRVGDPLTVEIQNLPPQAPVLLTYGTSGGSQYPLPAATSDQIGRLTIEVIIPPEARPGEQWVVTATTNTAPAQTFTSAPFEIGGTPR